MTLASLLRPGASQPAKYALVGVLNTLLDLAILNLLFWAFSPGRAIGIAAINVVSYGCGIVNSYVWNARWTFASPRWQRAETIASFTAVMILAWGINTGVVVAGHAVGARALPDSAALNIAKIVAAAASFTVGFILCRWWVFKEETPGEAPE
jgi:putative flippase GtrA